MTFRIEQCYGFSVQGAFKAIVDHTGSFITSSNLSTYIRSSFKGKLGGLSSTINGSLPKPKSQLLKPQTPPNPTKPLSSFSPNSQLILAILRRFDLDGRGKVSFKEFKKEMGWSAYEEGTLTGGISFGAPIKR